MHLKAYSQSIKAIYNTFYVYIRNHHTFELRGGNYDLKKMLCGEDACLLVDDVTSRWMELKS